jgi:hypothetical protein
VDALDGLRRTGERARGVVTSFSFSENKHGIGQYRLTGDDVYTGAHCYRTVRALYDKWDAA